MTAPCPSCNKSFVRLAKHISESHVDLAAEQERLVIAYYNAGLSARKIAAMPDILYKGSSSIVRILHKHYSAAELESGRAQRIGVTFTEKYAGGELDHVKAINAARSASPEGRRKNSAGLKAAYADGNKTSWSAGKTKYSDGRLLAMSQKLSVIMKSKSDAGQLQTAFRTGPDAPNWKGGISIANHGIRTVSEFSAGDKNHILRAAGNSCSKCFKTVERLRFERELLGLERWGLECDHIVPISAGGIAEPNSNGQALCSECHMQKSLVEAGHSTAGLESRYAVVDLRAMAVMVGGEFTDSCVKVGDLVIFVIDNRRLSDRDVISKLKLDNPSSIFLYRDEWITKSEIILSMVAHRLGKTQERLFARNLSVAKLGGDVANKFFDGNHIAGHVAANSAYGLMDGERLCAAISFRKPFTRHESDVVELARAATVVGTSVAGGLSKLLSAARNDLVSAGFSKILSYSDLRFGTGNSYLATNFTLSKYTRQDYCYSDGYRRYNRFRYRAQRGISESAVAEAAGMHKLWGLGHAKYIKHL